ncbi:hypothetical protein SAMN04487936_102331 [Halobacillus dabanensis]|uniref:Uncharacterized protein n=1 Tax=Halobacillus dabanensis TaxID=240302 RepID=A0A1I3RR93_HALDA|nr:hypothetical protein SAMN04487936_102331 [Halobacillus dabanensis]
MREDMLRVLDQRDYLVKENQHLQEQLEEERKKVLKLEQEMKQIKEREPLSTVGV